METYLWFAIILFLGGLIYSTVVVFNATANNDYANDMAAAIMNVTLVNSVLVLVLCGTGYFYTQQNPRSEQPYIMIMIHLSLLLATISSGVATIETI
jgi:cell division protein FtsW (lipid II flippase)